jgi:S-DNA-T family DNA segregation ATPase FtsK/SpoIIIE
MGRSGSKGRSSAGSGAESGVLRLLGALKGFLFGPPVDERTADRLREIKGLCLIGFGAFVLISMASFYTPYDDPGARGHNWGGQAGFYIANGVYLMMGLAGFLAVLLCISWGCVMVGGREVSLASLRFFGGALFVLSAAFLLQFVFGPDLGGDGLDARVNLGSRLPYGPGGWLALQSSPFLLEKFGGVGLFILLVVLALVSFMLATDMAFYPAVVGFREWLKERREERGESLLAALGGFARRTTIGLWNFLRGADLSQGSTTTDAATGVARAASGVDGSTPARARAASAIDLDEDEPAGQLKKTSRKRAGANETARTPTAVDDDEIDEEVATTRRSPTVRGEDSIEEEDALEEELDAAEESEGDELDEDESGAEQDDDEEREGAQSDAEDDEADSDEDEDGAEDEEPEESEREVVPAAASGRKSAVKPRVGTASLAFDPPTPPVGPWLFPPLDLLIRPEGNAGVDDKFLQGCAAKLENALRSFRVEASVVSAQVGPAVTLFELTVAQGTRMNKVTQLSQEIAAALRAQSVRIIAPIPGRETIGIEVPNAKRRIVRISELITQRAYDPKIMSLPLFIGMDAEGTPIVEDFTRMPHLLIAGTTGSGKSVCINTILSSLLLTRSPHDVKMILIDPKMVELQMFANVPHLMCPVVTDARQATSVLLWAVEKMEGRYELFRTASVKNIKSYNALSEDELKQRMGEEWDDERTPRHIPYIVVVVDEMADLMMTSKKEAELAITRLAQKSRAVGIHVIVATQRPSTDVITGIIKGNLPTRIAFQVASKIDSRVILDHSGAEKLLGGGDMLYTPPQAATIKRVQGALVEDSELSAIVNFVCTNSAPNFSQELIQVASGSRDPRDDGGEFSGSTPEDDPMFDEAVRVILKSKRGSASLLQRALGVGYTRASRLIDIMTEQGIVGPHKGSKSREILMTLEQWEEAHGAPMEHGAGGHGAAGHGTSQGASDE